MPFVQEEKGEKKARSVLQEGASTAQGGGSGMTGVDAGKTGRGLSYASQREALSPRAGQAPSQQHVHPPMTRRELLRAKIKNHGAGLRPSHLTKLQVLIGGTPVGYGEPDIFARDLARWQREHGVKPSRSPGSLDWPTLQALGAKQGAKVVSWSVRQSVAAIVGELSALDYAALGAASVAETEAHAEQVRSTMKPDDAESAGSGIASVAASQVGRVDERDRGDGLKLGWELIEQYYRVAGLATGGTRAQSIRQASRLVDAPKKRPRLKTGAFSWCGVFSVWAVKTATGKGGWSGGQVQGLTEVRGRKAIEAALRPGVIVNLAGSLNHHAVVQKVDRGPDGKVLAIHTVDGMQDYQRVRLRSDHAPSSVVRLYH